MRMEFITQLQKVYTTNANTEQQQQMEAYMRHLFPFHGIKAPIRKQLLKEVIKEHTTFLQEHVRDVVKVLYQLPQREYQYSAMELLDKFARKKYLEEDSELITKLITTHSWWDTVDFISKHILGHYLFLFPSQKRTLIDAYSESNNIWLNRAAILFQLGYKDATNEKELFNQCYKHKDSREFFIQKAIGWALREYGKVQPKAVLSFVKNTPLAPLSEREAIRRL